MATEHERIADIALMELRIEQLGQAYPITIGYNSTMDSTASTVGCSSAPVVFANMYVNTVQNLLLLGWGI